MSAKESLRLMQSGECRWIGREDVHAYCKAPMVPAVMPNGGKAWTQGPRMFAVVCPAAGLTDPVAWMSLDEAADLIEDILEGPDPIRDGWVGSDGLP